MYPRKLRRGDTVRVIAPACSRAFVNDYDHTAVSDAHFAELGLRLTYGEHVDERDDFDSSSIASRVADLHAAFADPGVAAILSVVGGFNSNELLPHLDWDLIAANPKVFCGYSDITALSNAIHARTGLVTYVGPHWSMFGMRDHLEQTIDWFTRTLFDDAPVELKPATEFTDDLWFIDQDARTVLPTDGWWTLRPGAAAGRVIGGHVGTLNLLQGTGLLPSLDGALLFVEADAVTDAPEFARQLTSLLQQPGAAGVRGLVVGRFQRKSGITRSLLTQIVDRQPALAGKPVLANADFGHTNPMATLPIGGEAEMETPGRLVLTSH